MFKLMQAVEYTHSIDVLHLDIKPSNVLFDPKTTELRLIDWGLAIYHRDGQPHHGSVGVGVSGSKSP